MQYHAMSLSIIISCMFFTAACGDKITQQPIQKEFVCADQGFCLTHDDGFRFYGGYRSGDHELQFQFAYNKHENGEVNTNDYCARIMTEERHKVIGHVDCGADWKPSRVRPFGIDMHPYQEISHKLLAHLQTTKPPLGREEQWATLAFYVQRFAEAPLTTPGNPLADKVLNPNPPTFGEIAALAQEYEVKMKNRSLVFANRHLLPTSMLDEMPTEIPLDSSEKGSDVRDSTLPLGWFGRHIMHDTDKINLAKYHADPTREFKQTLEIWAQKFNFSGIRFGSEHSATFVLVQSRPINSDNNVPWEKVIEFPTKNHGAAPGQGDMQRKRVCSAETFGITKGHYIVGGECDGSWLQDHVCNDDTAYQIRSAHGIWTKTNDLGEGVCLGRRRWNPPLDCRIPW